MSSSKPSRGDHTMRLVGEISRSRLYPGQIKVPLAPSPCFRAPHAHLPLLSHNFCVKHSHALYLFQFKDSQHISPYKPKTADVVQNRKKEEIQKSKKNDKNTTIKDTKYKETMLERKQDNNARNTRTERKNNIEAKQARNRGDHNAIYNLRRLLHIYCGLLAESFLIFL